MKKGIVIACHNVAHQFELMDFVDLVVNNDEAVFCLVNNGSSDPTRSVLALAKEYVEDRVLIYHLDQPHGNILAAHLGADFLKKETNVHEISYVGFSESQFNLRNASLNKIQL
jgi:hypothetical protein